MPSSGVQKCALDRKSTRLNSSHTIISYAVFCLKKKNGSTNPVLRRLDASCGGTAVESLGGPAFMAGFESPLYELFGAADPGSILDVFFLEVGLPPKWPPFPSPTLFR